MTDQYCKCTVDAELGAGSVCPSCGHRDHGRSGCETTLRKEPNTTDTTAEYLQRFYNGDHADMTETPTDINTEPATPIPGIEYPQTTTPPYKKYRSISLQLYENGDPELEELGRDFMTHVLDLAMGQEASKLTFNIDRSYEGTAITASWDIT